MKIEILPADPGHCALLARLHGCCFSTPWAEEAFIQMMAMPGAFALLAGRTEGTCREPIGFALARMGGGEAEIITLGVLPLWRVSGIGQQLVAAIAAQASACGVEALLLEVAEDNAAALKLYQSNGFSSVGRRKNYYQTADSGRHDAIVMRRALVAD